MENAHCKVCASRSRLISKELSVCLQCIRDRPERAINISSQTHDHVRRTFGLPEIPPQDIGGIRCGLCARMCIIGEGRSGFCGLRRTDNDRLRHLAGTPSRGLLHWYRDPLPTNCVADWVCSGHKRYGYHNLAVFYASCTFNCLFCQNWHFRLAKPELDVQGSTLAISAQALAQCANNRTFCVCFFGGDPASQMPHALAAGKNLAERNVAVCWETAGTMHPRLLRKAVDLSLMSGGCLKFDLKAFDVNLHQVLTGASNERTLENFTYVASRIPEHNDPPLLVASTLLVPGYVDAEEVGKIARFIASLDPEIPYSLLGFFPHFYMHDLPTTSSHHASEAKAAASEAGLRNIRLGNVQLFSNAY